MCTKYVSEATPETIAKQEQLKDRVRGSFLISPVIKVPIRTGRMKLLDIPAIDNCYCMLNMTHISLGKAAGLSGRTGLVAFDERVNLG